MRPIDADALPIWKFGLEWEEGAGVRKCCEAVQNAPTLDVRPVRLRAESEEASEQ